MKIFEKPLTAINSSAAFGGGNHIDYRSPQRPGPEIDRRKGSRPPAVFSSIAFFGPYAEILSTGGRKNATDEKSGRNP